MLIVYWPITEEVEALSKALNLPDAAADDDDEDYDGCFEDEDYV